MKFLPMLILVGTACLASKMVRIPLNLTFANPTKARLKISGQATKFYSSTVIKLFSSESDNQAIKGKIHVGDKLIEEKIGRKVRWELQFSKTSPAFQSGEYDFYFRGDSLGIDTICDLVDTAELAGYIARTGAWYQLEDGTKVQGREGLINRVKEDLDLQEMLRSKLNNG